MKKFLITLCVLPTLLFSQDENEISECHHFYTACEISQIVYDEYLFSIQVLQQFNPDDQFVNYMRGYSAACLNLYYRINLID